MQKTTLFGLLIVSVVTLSGCLENNDLTTVDDDLTVEATTGIIVEEIAEKIIETPLPDNIISPSGERNKYDDDNDESDNDKYDDDNDESDDNKSDNDKYDDNTTSQPASPAVITTTKSTTTTDTVVTFSLIDVAQHATPTDCRTAVDGNVYDVSSFVSKHPGGEQNILQVCGVEATRSFVRQHGSNTKAKAALASFKIGVIGQ